MRSIKVPITPEVVITRVLLQRSRYLKKTHKPLLISVIIKIIVLRVCETTMQRTIKIISKRLNINNTHIYISKISYVFMIQMHKLSTSLKTICSWQKMKKASHYAKKQIWLKRQQETLTIIIRIIIIRIIVVSRVIAFIQCSCHYPSNLRDLVKIFAHAPCLDSRVIPWQHQRNK